MEIFNGHFFSRYDERLNLNLKKPLEIVKTFFNNSGYFQYSWLRKTVNLNLLACVKKA
jgi:hypothetical protein